MNKALDFLPQDIVNLIGSYNQKPKLYLMKIVCKELSDLINKITKEYYCEPNWDELECSTYTPKPKRKLMNLYAKIWYGKTHPRIIQAIFSPYKNELI